MVSVTNMALSFSLVKHTTRMILVNEIIIIVIIIIIAITAIVINIFFFNKARKHMDAFV